MNPGSDWARNLGCTCDPHANGYGVGSTWGGKRLFQVDDACRLHGTYAWILAANPPTAPHPEEGTYVGGGLVAVRPESVSLTGLCIKK